MAYRAGGMSDSSDDELFYDENIVVPRKVGFVFVPNLVKMPVKIFFDYNI